VKACSSRSPFRIIVVVYGFPGRYRISGVRVTVSDGGLSVVKGASCRFYKPAAIASWKVQDLPGREYYLC